MSLRFAVFNKCRACLSPETIDKFIHLAGPNADMFKAVTCIELPIQSAKGDSMICPDCFSELERFQKFKIIATQAEREYFKLKRILAPVLKRCNDEAQARAVAEPVSTEFSLSIVEPFEAQTNSYDDSINNTAGKDRLKPPSIRRASEKKLQRSNKIHSCSVCEQKFPSLLLLDRHRSDCQRSMFNCDKCPYQTKLYRYFIKHRERAHGKCFHCETCQKTFFRKSLLQLHQRQHRHGLYATAPAETFDCGECGKSFFDPNYLKIHQKGVHDDNKVKCEVCDKICKNRKSLFQHRRSHIEIECSICNKIFTKQSLTEHMRSHCPQNLFKCDLCKHSTTRKGNLKTHIEKVHLPRKVHERVKIPRRVPQSRTAIKASTQEPESVRSKQKKIKVAPKDFESLNQTAKFMKNIQFSSTPKLVKTKAAVLGPRLGPSRQIQDFQ